MTFLDRKYENIDSRCQKGKNYFQVCQKVWLKKARLKKIKAPKNKVQKVWSRSVGTEIFLIWTNVARTNVVRTNVASTNVTVTVGFC